MPCPPWRTTNYASVLSESSCPRSAQQWMQCTYCTPGRSKTRTHRPSGVLNLRVMRENVCTGAQALIAKQQRKHAAWLSETQTQTRTETENKSMRSLNHRVRMGFVSPAANRWELIEPELSCKLRQVSAELFSCNPCRAVCWCSPTIGLLSPASAV